MKRFMLCVMTILPLLASLLCPVYATGNEALEALIIDTCIYETEADISEYEMNEVALDKLVDDLRNSGKLPWYAGDTYRYTFHKTTGVVYQYQPDILDRETYDRELYEQRIAEILALCVKDGMEDWQIALSLHDYLISNCVYDADLKLRTGYDLLVNGSTVCSGYTAVYQDLLLRVGIPCVNVVSEPMEHTWNLVQIGGEWYHVDVTWDDPSPDSYGYVNHQYFLVTDEEIRGGEEPHYDWVTDIACTSDRFSDAFFRNIESAICYQDSNICYLLRTDDWSNILYARDETTGTETKLYTDKANYINIGTGGNYTYQHYGLSLWNGRLYFNSLDRLHSIATDGSDLQTHHRYDTRANERYLKSCHVINDTAYFTVADHDGEGEPYTVVLESSGYHIHGYTETVVAPGCLEGGYTLSVCSCGLEAKSAPTKATGHNYQDLERVDATLFAEGSFSQQCTGCGDIQSEVLPQLTFSDWLAQLPENVVRLVVAVGITAVVLILRIRKKRA